MVGLKLSFISSLAASLGLWASGLKNKKKQSR